MKTEIQRLCDQRVKASTGADGGIVFSAEAESFGLLRNGVVFHELSHEDLCYAITGLNAVLLRHNSNLYVTEDHRQLWSWCGMLLLGIGHPDLGPKPDAIKDLLSATLFAALADSRRPTATIDDWEAAKLAEEYQPFHAQQFVRKHHTVLPYLALPLLDAVLKRACSEYLTLDGIVRVPFPDTTPGSKRPSLKTGDRCSSIEVVLWLLRNTCSSELLRAHLDVTRDQIARVDDSVDPFARIARWRNAALHGSDTFKTIGGLILGLAMLIALFEIESDFERRRENALQVARMRSKGATRRAPWDLYPLY